MSPTASDPLEPLALEMFEMTKIMWAKAQRAKPESAYDLTEAEFLALDELQRHACLTVGELQKCIRVLPAQMSRIIKGLETKYDQPLLTCAINTEDKRRIDLRITAVGRTAADTFRRAKLETTLAWLKALSPADLEVMARLVRSMRDANKPSDSGA